MVKYSYTNKCILSIIFSKNIYVYGPYAIMLCQGESSRSNFNLTDLFSRIVNVGQTVWF